MNGAGATRSCEQTSQLVVTPSFRAKHFAAPPSSSQMNAPCRAPNASIAADRPVSIGERSGRGSASNSSAADGPRARH